MSEDKEMRKIFGSDTGMGKIA